MNTVECPECGKALKTANPIAPGKKVRCPGCKEIFTMPAAKAASSTAVRTKSAPPPPRPSVDDDDDLPRPKRKRRDEEDDELDDEDEDDRPRKKKKKKKKAAGVNWALVGGGAGALVLVLILVLGFVWPGFFVGGGGGGPVLAAGTGQENLLAFLPKDSLIFVGLDATKNAELSKALQEGLFKKIQDQMNQMPGAGGMPPAAAAGLDETLRDAQKAVMGFSPKAPTPVMAAAISTSKPVDARVLAKAFGADKAPMKQHGSKAYFHLPDAPPGGPPVLLGIPNNRTVVIAAMPEEDFKGILDSDGQQVQLSAEAKALIASVDKNYFWGAVVVAGDLAQGVQMIDARTMPAELAPAVGAFKNLKGMTFSGEETPLKEQKISIALTCANDAESVVVCNAFQSLWQKKGRPMLAMVGMMAMQPGNEGLGDLVNDVTKSLKFENKGAIAHGSVSVREQTMKKMEQMQGQLMQNLGGMNPGGPPPGFPPPPGPKVKLPPPQAQGGRPSNAEIENAVRNHLRGNQQAGFQVGVPPGGKVTSVSEVAVEKSFGDTHHLVRVKVDYQIAGNASKRGSVTRSLDVRLIRGGPGWMVQSIGR